MQSIQYLYQRDIVVHLYKPKMRAHIWCYDNRHSYDEIKALMKNEKH